ncbi:MAG: SDR family oxidoreductase [Arenimonas sp.]|nr:SDR family oxidoreductase [Arenimonas sp.]
MNTALITGASSGVAEALARELASRGWKLSLACRDVSRLDPALGHVLAADVSTEAGAQAALAAASAEFGSPPAAVVNCAGSTLIAPISRTSEAQYRAVLSANLDTAFFVGKAYATALATARQGGALLFFSSVVAGIGVSNHAAIAAAKGGVEALTRSLAADFSGIGLRVNCIAPGLTRSPMTERMLSNEAAAKQIAAQYPLGRHGEAQDAAMLAAFLVSSDAGWITGQVIGLDGGFSAVRPYVKAS